MLQFTLNFISRKVRSYGAERLQDGGLTDQKFRAWIVRDMDDIKFKLDGLSRKDLARSVSCLKQGIERLNKCFGESIESENPSTSELPKNQKQLQDTTEVRASTSTQTNPAQKLVAVEDALRLANAIGKLKIESNEIFELAKESFKIAEEKASEAFHNAALSTEERVRASEVRIASGILEHLERPEVAASECLQYLRELHDLPAIQDIFSVHIQAGIKSRIKSSFKKDLRAEIVETVTMINLMLADFISKFTKERMAVFDWPMIECGKRVVHPIYYKEENVRKMKEMGITAPWNIVKHKETGEEFCGSYAINSKGDIIGGNNGGVLRKLDKATGKVKRFCHSRSDNKTWGERVIAIDDNDMVYILSHKGMINHEATLSVYSSDGRIILHCSMDFIEEQPRCIALVDDQNIVICSRNFKDDNAYVYACDSDGKLVKRFPIPLQSRCEYINSIIVSCDKSSEKEIILATREQELTSRFMIVRFYVCTQEGQLKRNGVLPLPQSFLSFTTSSIVFDHVTKNYIVYIRGKGAKETCVGCFSETGEQRNVLFLDDMAYITGSDGDFRLVNHASGVIAMVNKDSVLYLRYQ